MHISALSETFVKDPHSVVKAGDIVKVKIMEVDAARKRIGMSMRLSDEPGSSNQSDRSNRSTRPAGGNPRPKNKEFQDATKAGTMAALFEQAMKKK